MSKRGRRRGGSRRRQSSSSSKQSASLCVSPPPNGNHHQNITDKSNLFGKESEEEDHLPPKDKKFKCECADVRNIYTATTRDEAKGVMVVTSVSVGSTEDSSTPSITLRQCHEPLCAMVPPQSSILKVDCNAAGVRLELEERSTAGVTTAIVIERGEGGVFRSTCEPTSQATPFSFTFSCHPKDMPSHTVTTETPCCDRRRSSASSRSSPSPLTKRKHLDNSSSSDRSWDVPPADFSNATHAALEDVILGVASCQIDAFKQSPSFCKLENPFCLEVLGSGLELESDSGFDPASMRPSVSTNRSSFTRDFLELQATKPSLRNNSIATVEHRTHSLPKKRRQTFPRLLRTSSSLQDDHLMHLQDSSPSLCPAHGSTNADVDKFAVIRSYNVGKVKEKSRRRSSPGAADGSDGREDVIDHENVPLSSALPATEPDYTTLAIQVTPPSCNGSVEKMLQSLSGPGFTSSGHMTEGAGLADTREATCSTISDDVFEPQEAVVSDKSDPLKSKSLACLSTKQQNSEEDQGTLCRSVSENKELLKPVDGIDPWAKRRKLFKESKQRSSTGDGSITSDITECSVSEDCPSLDLTSQDTEVGGFYTETFHSVAWIYQGDSETIGGTAPSLNSRSRVVSIRERTVRINKGAGDYPWGFRIQFSKPIVVTEVDTNGAAEEAGLMVGDYVLAVNGTDVTSIPHSEAADLARQGPSVLTLTIGSDIARAPNTPRPGCRGYLHKRTQSGLIKGWRKRWFVLTHDCCLHYYRHKRDEGRRLPLRTLKLEGAEVAPEPSLGKPFVFKCCPLSDSRVYFLCATSNQEMKRWLEALRKALHPVTQNHVWVDVTQHNAGLPPLAVKHPECLGLLHKLDRIKDTWIRHYCILKDCCLYLYSGIRATHARGGIYLQGYTVREQPYGSRKCTIELKPLSDEFKSFYVCAENPNDNRRWIAAFKASIKKWWPLHQALQDFNNQPLEETRM